MLFYEWLPLMLYSLICPCQCRKLAAQQKWANLSANTGTAGAPIFWKVFVLSVLGQVCHTTASRAVCQFLSETLFEISSLVCIFCVYPRFLARNPIKKGWLSCQWIRLRLSRIRTVHKHAQSKFSTGSFCLCNRIKNGKLELKLKLVWGSQTDI